MEDYITKGFYSYELPEYNIKVISWNSQFFDNFNMSLMKNVNLASNLVIKLGDEIY